VTSPLDLTDLLDRVRQGDELALEDFLRHYELPLRRAAHALMTPKLRAQVDSVDVVQSVYRGLLTHLRDGRYALRKPDEFLALALTAIRNKMISKWRRAEHEHKLLQAVANNEATAGGNRAHLDVPVTMETREDIDRLTAGLSVIDRQLVEWMLLGLTSTEMAARLGADPHALRATLSRLRQKLRKNFESRDRLQS
jgi:RNA polymerase sigma factor (sigma-70 family)